MFLGIVVERNRRPGANTYLPRRYVCFRSLVRIIFISCTKFGQESSIITLIDGLLIDSIDCVPILRILRTKTQQLVCVHVGACMKSERKVWR